MKTYFRIIFTFALLLVAVSVPYWVTLALVVLGCALFNWYIEGLVIVFVTDLLFGVPLVRLHGFVMVHTFIAVGLYLLVSLGKYLTRYENF
jgi:predicted anti-sigma-YlaC factor YlaD